MSNVEISTFEGLWSLHFEDGTKKTVPGTLDITTYTLSTYCDFYDQENTVHEIDSAVKFYVTGKTATNHIITLYGCFYITVTMSSTFLEVSKIRYNQALIGEELLNDSVQKFDGIIFEMSCFESMMIPEEGLIEEIPRYGALNFSYYRDNNKNKKIKCTIDFNDGLSIQEAIDILHEIRCFFVFLYCKHVNITYNYLKIKNNSTSTRTICLIHSTYSDKKITGYHYEVLPRVGKNLFNRWADFFCIFEEQIRPIFEILTHSDFGSDRGLVTCAHAVEGFFRIISKETKELKNKRVEKNVFKALCKDIFDHIKSMKIDADIEKNIKDSVSYANEVSLRDRICQLLTLYLNEQLWSHFVIHPKDNDSEVLSEYIGIIVGIRNYYAHLDPSNVKQKIKEIIDDYLELYNYKVSVFSFLYTLIAKEYFKNDAQVAYRLSMHSEFPFSQPFYDDRVKPIKSTG